MRRLEAICDAIAQYHHYWEPESEAYELRNPGLILDADGKRRFSCHRAGYAAFMDRVQKHCAANPGQPIRGYLVTLGVTMRVQQEQAIDFMGRCANTTLDAETMLSWFVEK